MDRLFLTILNMSLTGAFIIAAICIARILLKKAPKIISYCLWAVAGFRLVFPFSIESVFSLIPQSIPEVSLPPRNYTFTYPPIGSPGWEQAYYSSDRSTLPSTPVWNYMDTLAIIWLIGFAVMLIYGIVSFIILKRKMHGAAHIEANIYESENIQSPFVLGIIKPKIYLPSSLTGLECDYIILHEQTHIRRRDHIVKFMAYFILCLHWFNPLAWVAFLLMSVDMEMSCDERVLKESDREARKDYSMSLLSLASERRIIGGSPLAFGEGGVKERIKRVLNFRKPSRVIVATALVVLIVLSVGFAVTRLDDSIDTSDWETFILPISNFDRAFFECNDSPYNPEYHVISAQLMNNQNLPNFTCGEQFTLVKLVNYTWKIVPFVNGLGFNDIAYVLDNGESTNYSINPDMLAVKLDEGQYRIVTDVWYGDDSRSVYTIWADFTIDKNAPKQEMFYTPSEWFGNFDGKLMTLDDLREIVDRIPLLTVDELFDFNYLNASSSLNDFNLLFATEFGTLQVYADSNYTINRITFKIQEAPAPLDLLLEPERLDDYINGRYVPLLEEALAPEISKLFDIFAAYARQELPLEWEDMRNVFTEAGYDNSDFIQDDENGFIVPDKNPDIKHARLDGNLTADGQVDMLVYILNPDGDCVTARFVDERMIYTYQQGDIRVNVSSVHELISYAADSLGYYYYWN